MTGPELVLAATFAAIWLLPIGLTIAWERRNRGLRASIERARAERARRGHPR